MIDWLIIGKPVVGPAVNVAVKPAAARAKEAVFGPEHEVAIAKICSRSLRDVLDQTRWTRHRRRRAPTIESVLEMVLNQAAVDGVLGQLGQPEGFGAWGRRVQVG